MLYNFVNELIPYNDRYQFQQHLIIHILMFTLTFILHILFDFPGKDQTVIDRNGKFIISRILIYELHFQSTSITMLTQTLPT